MRKFFWLLLSFWALSSPTRAADIRQPTAPNWPTNYPINGTVSVSNFPTSQPISGSVSVTNLPSTQPVSGTISVSNFPASQQVTGTVTVSTLPLTRFKIVSLSTTPVHVNASSTDLWTFYGYNAAAAGNDRSVKFYNSVAAPNPGVTVPDMTLTMAGKTGLPLSLHQPTTFSNGMWIIATTAPGDDNKTAPNLNDVQVTLLYR